MSDTILESISAFIMGIMVGYLWWIGRNEKLYRQTGWWYIITGFVLIFLGRIVGIAADFQRLSQYIFSDNLIRKAVIETTIGHLLGYTLIFSGLWHWLPLIPKLRQAEQNSKRTNKKLEMLVEESTAELKEEIEAHKRAEETLRESEAKNRALLDAIPDMMFRISEDGTYLEFMPAKDSEPLLLPSEFLGRTIFEVMPPEVAQPVMRYIEQALRSGEIQLFEYQLQMQGGLRYYEARLVVNGADEVLAIVRDITQRKIRETLIEAERARIARDLYDGLAQSLYLLGLKLDYRYDDKKSEQKTNIHLQDKPVKTQAISPLTDLELEILHLVAEGLSNGEIGDRLALAEKTIGNRLTTIFTKLNVDNRVQAALYALRQGLVSSDKEHEKANQ